MNSDFEERADELRHSPATTVAVEYIRTFIVGICVDGIFSTNSPLYVSNMVLKVSDTQLGFVIWHTELLFLGRSSGKFNISTKLRDVVLDQNHSKHH